MGKRNRRLVLRKSLKRITVYLLVLLMMASILSPGAFASKAADNNGEVLESSQQLLSDSGVTEEAAENNEEGSEEKPAQGTEEGEEGTQQPYEEALAPETGELDNLEPGEDDQEEATPLTPEAEEPKEITEEDEEVQPGEIMPYANGDRVTTANTSGFLDINLFDYTTDANESSGNTVRNVGINQNHALKFSPGGMGSNDFNSYTNSAKTFQGIVQRVLDNGYPKLHSSVHNGQESLKYLFDHNNIDVNRSRIKSSYVGMNNLFLYNSNSRYYSFDSTKYYAVSNTINDVNNKNFTVYEDTRSRGFFPFNQYNTLTSVNPGNANHYFGLHVKGNFLQPVNGKITKTDGIKEDMIFEFSGDDDLWVFIDGVLILDIGGIHQASSGSINFATGNVDINNGDKYTRTTIKKQFEDATMPFDGRGDTYKDNTLHSIDIFYLERGNYESNLKIKFNLDLVRTGDIRIAKEIKAEEGSLNEAVDINRDYTFTLYKKVVGASGTGTPMANTRYTLRRTSGVEENKVTSSNGTFTLKPGEYATFSEMDLDFKYYVVESGLLDLDYKEVTFTLNNGSVARKPIVEGTVTSEEFLLSQTQNSLYIVCTNVVSKNNLMSLEIMKKLKTATPEEGRLAEHTYGNNSFLVEVTIGGALYRNGAYSLYSTEDQGLTWTLVSGNLRTSSDGKLTIKPNEKAVITGLLGGTSFKVKEVGGDRFERFTPSYEITGGKNTSTTNGAEGLLNTASDSTNIKKVVVTINNKPASTSIAIAKIDSTTGLKIGVATFFIYGDEALRDKLTEAVSQPGTSLVISGLMVGETYYIKEVRAPEGYKGDDLVYKLEITSVDNKTITPGNVNGGKWSASESPVTPTVDADLTIKNHKLSLIRLIKKDNADGYLAGVTFRLEKLNEDYFDEETTDASGIVEFANLLPGRYRITEIKTVQGYTLLTKPITIELPLKEITAPKDSATIMPYAEAEGIYYYDIVEYIISNSKNFTVPTTGGSNYFYVGLAGVALMAVALGGLIYRKKSIKGLTKKF